MVLLAGGFITIFDLFVVNVAVPSIQSDLNADFSDIGFVIAGYELAFGVLLIAGGRLGDRYGRRRLFALGMVAFAVTSGLCGLAPGASFLVAARFFQGMAAALLFPQIYSLIRVLFDEGGRRRAFGFLGMTLGLAAIAGQVLGGVLVEGDLWGLGWRIIFLINLPIGITAALLSGLVPESRAPDALGMDWTGVGLASLGLLLLLAPLLEGPSSGWPAWTILLLAMSMVLLSLFVRWERRLSCGGGSPVIDMTLLGDMDFSAGMLAVLALYSTATSFFLCFAMLLQSGMGLTPLQAGSTFAPASVGFVAASLAAPGLVARFGNGAIAVGALTYAVGTGLLITQVAITGGAMDAVWLVPALIVFGFGQGLSMTPLLNLVLGFVEARRSGMAAGIISTMQQVGGAFGVSIVGIFFVELLGPADTATGADRYAEAFAGAMVYNLAAALVAAFLIGWIARRRVVRA
jgi:EmrB/QacA subfamily drug resistance transporter